jgi:hypothetical protein
VFSVLLFKRRAWPLWLGTGFGAGRAVEECDSVSTLVERWWTIPWETLLMVLSVVIQACRIGFERRATSFEAVGARRGEYLYDDDINTTEVKKRFRQQKGDCIIPPLKSYITPLAAIRLLPLTFKLFLDLWYH